MLKSEKDVPRLDTVAKKKKKIRNYWDSARSHTEGTRLLVELRYESRLASVVTTGYTTCVNVDRIFSPADCSITKSPGHSLFPFHTPAWRATYKTRNPYPLRVNYVRSRCWRHHLYVNWDLTHLAARDYSVIKVFLQYLIFSHTLNTGNSFL